MKEVEFDWDAWKIKIHVRLSTDQNTKWIGSYVAESTGHLPAQGVTAECDEPDRAFDRAIGDALRAVHLLR